MKALSVKQPWAWLLVSGQKTIEVRVWSRKSPLYQVAHAHVGQRIAIHASGETDLVTWSVHCLVPSEFRLPNGIVPQDGDFNNWGPRKEVWEKFPLGRVAGTADLVEVIRYRGMTPFNQDRAQHHNAYYNSDDWNRTRSEGLWVFGLRFANPLVYDGAPVSGHLGFWSLPDDYLITSAKEFYSDKLISR